MLLDVGLLQGLGGEAGAEGLREMPQVHADGVEGVLLHRPEFVRPQVAVAQLLQAQCERRFGPFGELAPREDEGGQVGPLGDGQHALLQEHERPLGAAGDGVGLARVGRPEAGGVALTGEVEDVAEAVVAALDGGRAALPEW